MSIRFQYGLLGGFMNFEIDGYKLADFPFVDYIGTLQPNKPSPSPNEFKMDFSGEDVEEKQSEMNVSQLHSMINQMLNNQANYESNDL
jgi:hypothetical protein